ncbi:MAG: lipopolysaccharide biosynthesis protein [Myxococcota bacterium]
MKDEARIVTNALVTYGAKLATGSIGFLMVPFLIRSLGESTYGVMGVCWSILGFMLLLEMGVRPALTRQFTDAFFRNEIRRSNEIASSGLCFYLTISTFILVTLALFRGTFLSRMNVPAELVDDAEFTLMLVGVSASLSLLAVPFLTALHSQLRHDIQMYVVAGKSATTAAVIVTTFTLAGPHLTTWATIEVLAATVVFAIYAAQAHRVVPSLQVRLRNASRRGFGDVASFGGYTVLLGAAGWVDMQSGPLVISYFMGTAAVAHFTPVVAVIATLMPLHAAFLSPLRSFITKAHAIGDWSVIRRTLIRSTRYSLLTTGAIVVVLGALSSRFIPLWLGEGFEDTSQVLLLWSAAWVAHASTGASYGIYIGTGKLRMITALNTTLSILTLSIGIWLVGSTDLGIVGIAVGALTAHVIRATAFFIYSTHLCDVSRTQYLREGFVGPLFCLAALGATCYGVSSMVSGTPFVDCLAGGAAGGLVYLPLAWGLGLRPEDRVKGLEYLRRILGALPFGPGSAGR